MLYRLILRKANHRRLQEILTRENFIFTDKDVELLLRGNQKGTRYGNAVLVRNENGKEIQRFIKILLNGEWETYKLFKRQVMITSLLGDVKEVTFPTLKVITRSLTSPVPYAIFETRDTGEGFGFMHDSPQFYHGFNEHEMRKIASLMYEFHASGLALTQDAFKYAQTLSSSYWHYKEEVKEFLETCIVHKRKDGTVIHRQVETLLQEYMGTQDIRKKIYALLDEVFAEVNKTKKKHARYLVHADMQIDNVYQHQNGDFEFLDFEWVGKSESPVIAIAYDYGNLRGRAWSSPQFQKMLDVSMQEEGKKYHKDHEIIRSGLLLGAVRSTLMMCRFHLDFKNTVKKDKRTEDDYHAMYPKSITALKEILSREGVFKVKE